MQSKIYVLAEASVLAKWEGFISIQNQKNNKKKTEMDTWTWEGYITYFLKGSQNGEFALLRVKYPSQFFLFIFIFLVSGFQSLR